MHIYPCKYVKVLEFGRYVLSIYKRGLRECRDIIRLGWI